MTAEVLVILVTICCVLVSASIVTKKALSHFGDFVKTSVFVVGGLNVFAAAFFLIHSLFFVLVVLSGSSGQKGVFASEIIAPVIAGALGFYWIENGLVPADVERDELLGIGHLLIFAGTIAFTSGTYLSQLLPWLGLDFGLGAIGLSWLVIFSVPIGLVAWFLGISMVAASKGTKDDDD